MSQRVERVAGEVRAVIGEALALGMLAGAIGISLAYAGLGLLRRILPANFPRLAEISIDGRVLGATVLIALLTSLIAGVAPSIQGLVSRLSARLRSGRTIAGAGGRVRGSLVAAEMALAVVLTIGAGLMGRTLIALGSADRGLRSDHLLTMRLQPAVSKDAARPYWRDLLSRVETVPGVVSAGTILHLPASGRQWQADIEIDGRPVRPRRSGERGRRHPRQDLGGRQERSNLRRAHHGRSSAEWTGAPLHTDWLGVRHGVWTARAGAGDGWCVRSRVIFRGATDA